MRSIILISDFPKHLLGQNGRTVQNGMKNLSENLRNLVFAYDLLSII